GGGGFRGSGISRVGKNAPLGFNGDAGDDGSGKNGNGGLNGLGGEGGTNTQTTSISGGGGGILGDGVPRGEGVFDTPGNFTGKKGLPAGGSGGLDQGDGSAGGWGMGGGGSGNDAGAFRSGGGGGGGYSGGGGGAQGRPGGGGGSYGEPMYGAVGASSGNSGDHGSAAYEFTRLPAPPQIAIDYGAIGLSGSFAVDTAGSSFDTVVAIYNNRGEVVAQGDNSPFLPGGLTSFTASLDAGEYWMGVCGAPNGPLDNFTFESSSSASGVVAGHIHNTEILGSIVNGGNTWFNFEIGQRPTDFIDAGVIGVSGSTTLQIDRQAFDMVLGLYDNDGQLLVMNDDDQDVNIESRIIRDLDPGVYFLSVTEFGDTPGNFFTFDSIDNERFGPTVQVKVGSQTISRPVPRNTVGWIRFEIAGPTPSQTVDLGVAKGEGATIVNTLGSSFDTTLALLTASGELLGFSDDANGTPQSQIATTLDAGTYYAAVTSWPQYVSANFAVNSFGGDGSGGTIAGFIGNGLQGVNMSGSLAPGEVRYFKFEISEFARPCNGADLAMPYQVLSQTDVNRFVSLFFSNDPRVTSLAEPRDVASSADVDEFIRLWQVGCPN
ncbi:MAG: DVUA0089 family protein, partial [Pseudomonadota bacterium]